MASTSAAKILFFAKARELVGQGSGELQLDGSTELSGAHLKRLVLQQFPQLQIINESFVLALDQNYVENDDQMLRLTADSELAVIPPLSGG